jgi:hypothetical protein
MQEEMIKNIWGNNLEITETLKQPQIFKQCVCIQGQHYQHFC